MAVAQEFWEVFASSGNPMLLVDDNRGVTDANPAACRFLRRRREEIVGHEVDELTPASRLEEIDQAWDEFITAGHVVRSWALTDSEGRELPVKVAVTAHIPERGRHLGVVLTNGDAPRQPARARLSPREREITQLLAMGLSGEAIARELFLSPETVRTHIRNAMEHAGARTRAHLVAVALRDGLIADA